jgi:hypothetical protein
MHHAEEWNDIEGIQICRGSPSVSHLFLDDSLILRKATNHNAAFLWDLIEVYEVCSFQQIKKTVYIIQQEYKDKCKGKYKAGAGGSVRNSK